MLIELIREHRAKKGYDKRGVTVNRDKYIEECREAIEVVEPNGADHLQRSEIADNLISLVGYVDSKGWDLIEMVKRKISINENRDR